MENTSFKTDDLSHVLAPRMDETVVTKLFVCAQRNETFEDVKYGTLRTVSRSGGWDDTPENRELAKHFAADDRRRLGDDWTVWVALEMVTTVVDREWFVIE